MSDLTDAITSLNNAADRATATTEFFDEVLTADDDTDVTNPSNNVTVSSMSKQVKERVNSLYSDDFSSLTSEVQAYAESAAESAALASEIAGLDDVAGALALSSPANIDWDLFVPFNDGISITKGFGTNDQIDVSAAQDGSVMVDLPSVSAEFSRNSVSNSINKSGIITSESIDNPIITSDGIGIFESVTNEFLYSEDFSNSYWNKEGGVTVTSSSSILAPDGTSDSWLVETTTDSGFRAVRRILSPALSGETWCYSLFAKSGNIDEFRIQVNSVGSGTSITTFNLSSGTATDTGGLTDYYGIKKINDGWFLCYVIVTVSDDNPQVKICDLSVSSSDIGDNIYIWGAQATESSFLAPYISTSASSVTRAEDFCSLQIENNLPAVGKPFSIIVDADISEGGAAWWIGVAGSTNMYLERTSGTNRIRVVCTGTNIVASSDDYRIGERMRLVYVFNGNNSTSELYADGDLLESDTTDEMFDYLDSSADFQVGSRNNGNRVNSYIKSLRIVHRALTADEVKALGGAK